MISKDSFKKALKLINKSENIIITSHLRPDGDSAGSVSAISQALKAQGKNTLPVFLSPLPDWYEFLFDSPPAILENDVTTGKLDDFASSAPALLIIIDTNSRIQLPVISDWLKNRPSLDVLVIDHHLSSDGLGSVSLVDTSAAAAGKIVFDLFKYACWDITPLIAESLFVAVATDTGWFRFSAADSEIYNAAAELIKAGANPTEIYSKLYQNYSVERMELLKTMLNSLELYYDNSVAFQTLLRTDFDRTGANGRDTENLIDNCQKIRSVEVAALFVELGEKDSIARDANFRCSLRSKGHVDVRQIAQPLGGGGHALAAGVNLKGTLDDVKAMILEKIAQQLKTSK